MTKILFEHKGKQMLVEVGFGGGVAAECVVLWDERIHGRMPGIEMGGMVADDSSGRRELKLDPVKLKAFQDAKAAKEKEENEAKDRVTLRRFRIRTHLNDIEKATTVAKVQTILKDILEELADFK